MTTLVDAVGGTLAVVGVGFWLLCAVLELLGKAKHALSSVHTSRAKLTLDEMYQEPQYAGTRNAKQALTRKGRP